VRRALIAAVVAAGLAAATVVAFAKTHNRRGALPAGPGEGLYRGSEPPGRNLLPDFDLTVAPVSLRDRMLSSRL
jgi:hypothetical protein